MNPDRIDFNKYLLPTVTSNVENDAESEAKIDRTEEKMPSIMFRDGKVCPGIGKAEDYRLAKNSPIYLRLELA